ncbi:MAG: glycosyltransferase family 39 protein [Bacteroides sp.]|nr:glycosyltransferase family 39 protein [Bacteroides sp.]
MKRIVIFTLVWFVFSLVQAFFTEIVDDEAYYWVYSRALDWGYFDHPPMIALLIKMGYALFPGELGVRLLPSLLGAGTIFLVFLMLKDKVKDLRLLMLVSLSIPLVHSHVAGPLAIPDLPLVFFATLFFYFYKRYLDKETPLIIFMLGLSITLMLYSKYNGFLVIGFTILSNLKLLTRRSFWVLVAISVTLYLPHILWQVKHDFVSFGYHLVDRNAPFEFKYLVEYIGNQILMVGPFCWVILIYLGFARKAENKFELALKFNLFGFFLGFMISSLKGHVEPHWTAFAIVPLIMLSVPEIDKRMRLKKWVLVLSYLTLPLIFLLRLFVITDIGILPEPLSHRFLHKKEYYLQIKEGAGDRPVVFTNSYQHPSLYWYFTKDPSFSRNDRFYRRNQYDLMNMEAELQGKEVLYFTRIAFPGVDSLKTTRSTAMVYNITYYGTFNRVEISLPDMEWDFEIGEMVQVDLELINPTDRTISFSDSCSFKPSLIYTYYSEKQKGRAFFAKYENKLPDLAPGEHVIFPVKIRVPYVPGKYQVMISFGAEYLPAGLNGRPVKMTVHSRSKAN